MAEIISEIFKNLNGCESKTECNIEIKKSILYLGSNSLKLKWNELPKDIKFKKIKEYLYKKSITIRITDYLFNNINYNVNTQTVVSIKLVKK